MKNLATRGQLLKSRFANSRKKIFQYHRTYVDYILWSMNKSYLRHAILLTFATGFAQLWLVKEFNTTFQNIAPRIRQTSGHTSHMCHQIMKWRTYINQSGILTENESDEKIPPQANKYVSISQCLIKKFVIVDRILLEFLISKNKVGEGFPRVTCVWKRLYHPMVPS